MRLSPAFILPYRSVFYQHSSSAVMIVCYRLDHWSLVWIHTLHCSREMKSLLFNHVADRTIHEYCRTYEIFREGRTNVEIILCAN